MYFVVNVAVVVNVVDGVVNVLLLLLLLLCC